MTAPSLHWRDPGVRAALLAAILFGAGTPLAKLLLGSISPWQLAGLLYLGSGLGLTLLRFFKRSPAVHLSAHDSVWLAGAILSGGVVAPVLLMFGLTHAPASEASLLLNAEGVFTALLAWFVFREHFSARIAVGMAAIVLGAVILSWPAQAELAGLWPALAILGACLGWAIDNNLTRKVALTDATWIAAVKGLASGTVNLVLAWQLGSHLPGMGDALSAMVVGLLAYGVSLVLFVLALRQLGTARTGAYFSIAPFIGAVLALGLGEQATWHLLVAGLFMALGVWLHVTERHAHEHTHEALAHEHEHVHDEHHQHAHDVPVASGTRHSHWHQHEPLRHSHAHFPDAHHQHNHGGDQ